MSALRLAIALLVLLVAMDASAFHLPDSFVRTANRGGGSKILYTGSSRFRGYDCTMCHGQPSGAMQVLVSSDPPELLEGTYKPLQEYAVTVEMVGELLPPEGESNFNLFVADVVDDGGEPVGRFEEIELSSLQRVSGDVNVEGAVFGSNDRARWTFTYAAPAKDAGRIAFHLGAVSGDSGASQGEEAPPSDPFGDQVFVMEQRACEQFTGCDTAFEEPAEAVSPVGHGCSIGPMIPTRGDESWLVLALALVATRRR
jgi:hypothetical protein